MDGHTDKFLFWTKKNVAVKQLHNNVCLQIVFHLQIFSVTV